jgi:hypothetical protein
MANTNKTPKSIHDCSDYGTFSTDLEGIVCVKCHETIKVGDSLWNLNFGRETKNRPVSEYLSFTGLYWHEKCLNIYSLPGMEHREGLEEEFFGRSMRTLRGSKLTH